MRNATSSGAGGHLYGIPAMPMTIRPPRNASSARRSRAAAVGGVEVMGLGVEVLDRLGHDPRAGREDEMVVAKRQAIGQGDDPRATRRRRRPRRR